MKASGLAFLVLALAACSPRAPSVTYESGLVKASGWNGPPPANGWETVFTIRAGDDPDAPLLLGAYKESGGVIVFTPRFPPSPGVMVHVRFQPQGKQAVEATFGEPAKAIAPSTRVAHIYPSTDVWPANTLRMYVEFSAPMSAGEAYSHIRVVDDRGRVIDKPFVEIEPELWDPAGKRLTLLFDPGRIKRGLVDNETSGPPLVPGHMVTLDIDPAWRDASGAPLVEKFVRQIRVVEAVRATVDPKRWRIDSPRTPSGELVIGFGRPLDHALAQRAISVMKDGSPIAGKIVIDDGETIWRFSPESPWAPGDYSVVVDGVIEDLAGNRPGKLFDVDTSDPLQSTSATAATGIPFSVPGR